MVLNDVLNFKEIKSREEIQNKFNHIADYLFNDCLFKLNGHEFYVKEVELGLHIDDLIEDKFHYSYYQMKTGRFYVHKKGQSYKSGRIIGLDITAGGKLETGQYFYGTLLIRSIQFKDSDKVIEGPGRVLLSLLDGECEEYKFRKWAKEDLTILEKIDGSLVEQSIIETRAGQLSSILYLGSRVSISRLESDFLCGNELLLRASSFLPAKAKKSMKPIEAPLPNKEIIADTSTKEPSKDFSMEIETENQIHQFLKTNDLSIGGALFNKDNLKVLNHRDDLKGIGSAQPGCYFIFSTIPETEIPTISVDGYKGYQPFIEKEGEVYRCLYNGKGQKLKERLQQHLFNSHTLEKVLSKDFKNNKLSGTGAMSLDSISLEEALEFEKNGLFIPSKQKLKPVQKALHPDSHLKLEGQQFFLNGIDITEEKWSKYKFAVCVVKTDSEFGKILIEEGFAVQNGRPPLCRRHG